MKTNNAKSDMGRFHRRVTDSTDLSLRFQMTCHSRHVETMTYGAVDSRLDWH